MLTKRFEATPEPIYTDPMNVFDAFSDIWERIGSSFFENITYDDNEGVIEYDVPDTNRHIVKVFDKSQGLPEYTADVMQWLFSMLDGAVNMD